MATTFSLDPDAVLDFAFDWMTQGWLAESETITEQTVVAAAFPDGDLTVSDISQAGGVVTWWASDGVLGTVAVTCHITTSEGRQDDRTMTIKVLER